MDAVFINEFRMKIRRDYDYYSARRDFHEHYEWLEAYWWCKFGSMDEFCKKYGSYFWSLAKIRNLAKNFAFSECVGNSNDAHYEQTQEIAKATMFLRYKAGLTAPEEENPNCAIIGCRNWKSRKGWCNEIYANQWTRGEHAAFKALMYIVRQIRNNLFHGNKLELVEVQYMRNKELVQTAASVTKVVLNNLQNAEQHYDSFSGQFV